MRSTEFHRAIESILARGPTDQSLESYLRALWGAVDALADRSPTWELFIDLLDAAWGANGPPFNPAWLQFEHPPVEADEATDPADDFAFFRATILFQIADLHRMASAQYFEREPYELYFGVESPSGAYWYNFFPAGFLECAAAGFAGYSRDPLLQLQPEWEEATWRDFADFLHLGQIYE